MESGREGGDPGPGPSAPLGGGGVVESGRHGGGPAASLRPGDVIQARYQRRIQRRFGPAGPPWMQSQNKEDDDEEEVAHQARTKLEQEEDAARYETERDAKRARAWAAVGVDIDALDSGTRNDPRSDALDFSTPRETAPWVSDPDRIFEQM